MSQPFSLDAIQVAAPCPADWEAMAGTGQVRFCGQCQLNVYNLSGMRRAEAEALVRETEGRLCVRFFKRADGTLITQDCPVGLQTLYRRQARTLKLGRAGKLAATVTLMTAVGMFCATGVAQAAGKPAPGTAPATAQAGREIQGEMAVGRMAVPPQTPAQPTPTPTMGKPMATPVMGDVAMPPVKPDKPCPLQHPSKKSRRQPAPKPASTNGQAVSPTGVPTQGIVGTMALPEKR